MKKTHPDLTPEKTRNFKSHSEPRMLRTPLSLIKDPCHINQLTPSSNNPIINDNSSFSLDQLDENTSQSRANKLPLPLPLLVKPTNPAQTKDISALLSTIRSKANKSTLKTTPNFVQKNVTFSLGIIKENTVEGKSHSIATTTHSMAESRGDVIKEDKNDEEIIKNSEIGVEFDEFPAIVYCERCRKEVVTSVRLEKPNSEKGIMGKMQWKVCWWVPACLFSGSELVHRCPSCNFELARIEGN
jgi:hypothetical protein